MNFCRIAFVSVLSALPLARAAAEPTAIAQVQHAGDVDFEKEILPIFRRNCLACHSATEAQGDLVLETPAAILKGGSEGPAVVAGKSAESRLLQLASLQKEPHMPPPDNDVKAKPLTPQELGLIKLWIDQGAKGNVAAASSQIAWQPLPPGINPIYAAAIDAHGQYAAASRANQIFVYHVPSKRELGRLTDPALLAGGIYKQPGVADLDLIQSLRFSPDGTLLASGGFRTVKLWRKAAGGPVRDVAKIDGAIRTLAASPSGTHAALGLESGDLLVVALSSGKLQSFKGHTAAVTGAAFAADGAKLVTAALDKTIRVWTIDSDQPSAAIETPAAVHSLALVGQPPRIATGGADGTVRLWDLPAGAAASSPAPTAELKGHSGPVLALAAIGAEGKLLASGGEDGSVRLWDVASGKETKLLQHAAPVSGLAASGDGKRLTSFGGPVGRLWNVENGQQIAELKGDLRLSLKAEQLAREVSLAKKHVELAKKDLEEAKQRKTAEEDNQKKAAEALAKAEADFKPKDEAAKKAAADKATADKALADAAAAKTSGEETQQAAAAALARADEALKALKTQLEAVAKLEGEPAAAIKTAAEKATSELTELRKHLAAGKEAADKAAQAATAAHGEAEKKQKEVAAAHQKASDEQTAAQRTLDSAKRGVERAAQAVKAAGEAIAPAEALVKQAEERTKAREAAHAAAAAAVKAAEKPIVRAALLADGRTLVTAGADEALHTWDIETGAPLEVLSGPAAAAVAAAAGGQALVASEGALALWNAETHWRHEQTIGSADDASVLVDRVTALDFSPDGKLLAVGGGEPSRSGEIKLFDATSGQLVRALKDPHSDTVNCLAFSPDGTQLASGAADRFAKLWKVADGSFVRAFEGHTHHVLGVAWRADGRMLVTSGADTVLKVWDPRSGDQLRTVQNQFTKEVTSVVFLGEGDQVSATGGDARLRVINAASGNSDRTFSGPAEYLYCAAATASGKTIVAGGLDSVVWVFNDQGQEMAKFPPPAQPSDRTAAK